MWHLGDLMNVSLVYVYKTQRKGDEEKMSTRFAKILFFKDLKKASLVEIVLWIKIYAKNMKSGTFACFSSLHHLCYLEEYLVHSWYLNI